MGACDNRALQRRAFVRGVVRPVTIGGKKQWGYFLQDAGKKGDVVEEYVGEGITYEEFQARLPKLRDTQEWYFCSLANGVILDATTHGNYARFVNHSCQPTAELQPWSVHTYRRIAIALNQDLEAGREVTVSYDFEEGELEQECACGAEGCTGKIRRLSGERPPPANKGKVAVTSSPPAVASPVRKRGRTQLEFTVVGAAAAASEPTHDPASANEAPSDADVRRAMLQILEQLQEAKVSLTARSTWEELGVLLRSPRGADYTLALTSSHADNVRAILTKQGPPFLLTEPLTLDSSAGSQTLPSEHEETVIDLTDDHSPRDRLDESASAGGVQPSGGGSDSNAASSAGGEGVGRH